MLVFRALLGLEGHLVLAGLEENLFLETPPVSNLPAASPSTEDANFEVPPVKRVPVKKSRFSKFLDDEDEDMPPETACEEDDGDLNTVLPPPQSPVSCSLLTNSPIFLRTNHHDGSGVSTKLPLKKSRFPRISDDDENMSGENNQSSTEGDTLENDRFSMKNDLPRKSAEERYAPHSEEEDNLMSFTKGQKPRKERESKKKAMEDMEKERQRRLRGEYFFWTVCDQRKFDRNFLIGFLLKRG